MAKKRLFGNRPEPRCETCTYGKLSVDESVVLCRRGGVTPRHHSCRHYHYDPLKRTPKRQKPLDAFDAAAFSLSGLADEVPAEAAKLSPDDSEMLQRLHSYLNDNATPDAQAILDILAIESTETATPEESPAEDLTPVEEVPVAVVPNALRATPETIPSPLIPDNTPDIFEDLKRLQVHVSASSTHAALQNFSFKLGEDVDDEDEPEVDPLDMIDTTVLTLEDEDDTDDEAVLNADDLIFASIGDPDEDELIETLEINGDGSISSKTQKIADLEEY